jgi:hypothetical protein
VAMAATWKRCGLCWTYSAIGVTMAICKAVGAQCNQTSSPLRNTPIILWVMAIIHKRLWASLTPVRITNDALRGFADGLESAVSERQKSLDYVALPELWASYCTRQPSD